MRQSPLRYYREPNGDYLCVDPSTEALYLEHFGKHEFEGRATCIEGLITSVCTTSIAQAFLDECKRVPRKSVPKAWIDRFYPVEGRTC